MTNLFVSDFIILFLIFLRISSAIFTAPIFGHESFPTMAKLFVSLIISYIVFVTLIHNSFPVEPNFWFLAVNGAKEVITGLLIGLTLQFVFYGVSFAGSLIGFDMGLYMADIFHASDGTQNNILGEFLYLTAIMVFLLINGHHYIVRALVESFAIVPIGKFVMNGAVFATLVKMSGGVFIIAVKIASPILVSFFLINIAEGIMARSIPQMQVFFVTQPLKLGLGILMIGFIIPVYIMAVKGLLKGFEDELFTLIKAMGQ